MTGHRYVYALQGRTRAVLQLGVLLTVLNAALVVPPIFVSGLPSAGPADFVSFDLGALLALIILSRETRMQRTGRRLATGLYVLLLLYTLYDAAIQIALKRPGLVYDDVQHIVGTIHLIGNAASSFHLVLGGVSIALLIGFCGFVVRAFRAIDSALKIRLPRRILTVALYVSLPVVLYGFAFDLGNNTPLYDESVIMTGEKMVHNLVASAELRERVQEFNRLPADSTYAQYETIRLSRRPHLYLLFIESYGEVLRHHEETAAPYRAMMQELGNRLSGDGWRSASTTSIAPVNGGTSWLSVGSVLMGMPIKHQSLFNAIEPDLHRYPHFIHTLKSNGYRTAVLQPPTRPRLGIGVSNPYGFDDTFYFADMEYTGPRYGWGIVPDQYSLHFAHERVIAQAEQPVALLFEMVASHTPWEQPPPLVDDWRILNDPAPDALADMRSARMMQDEKTPVGAAGTPPVPPLPNVSAGKNAPIHRLFRTIRYDWQVISEYMINEMPDSSLVVVLGDHQPPTVPTKSNAVPVHLFSQTSGHINTAISNGFQQGLLPKTEGMQPTASTPPFRHAGLYSLVMNLLAQPGAFPDSSRSLSVLPNGVQRPALRLSVSP